MIDMLFISSSVFSVSREYKEARVLMSEKSRAETDFTALSKRIQQKKVRSKKLE